MRIRPARRDEAPALTALCLRSIADRGYDAALLKTVRPNLEVKPEAIARGDVLACEDQDGRVVGMAAIGPTRDADAAELELLFIDDGWKGRRIGTRLFEAAAARARKHGARRLVISSDRESAGFYDRMGCRREGETPSRSIPGSFLPFYEFDLTADSGV